MENLSGSRYGKHSPTLYATLYDTSTNPNVLRTNYLTYSVEPIFNSHTGCLHGYNVGQNCIGTPSYPFAAIFSYSYHGGFIEPSTGLYTMRFFPHPSQNTRGADFYANDYGTFYIDGVNTTLQIIGYIDPPSSREYKEDIKPIRTIDRLEAVEFKYKDDEEKKTHFGLIYEDTIKIVPEICVQTPSKKKAISYVELVPVLLKEIQELRKRVAELEKKEEKL